MKKNKFNFLKPLFIRVLYALFSVFYLLISKYELKAQNQDICATKYPIILVHGVAWRDDIKLLKYWSNTPKFLEKKGATVYLSHQNALQSHVQNAILIKKEILRIIHETNCEKVNIIAHSKGGIECRYMISKLEMGKYVASLTTISTPHRGSAMADQLLLQLRNANLLSKFITFANWLGRTIGDKNPDALAASKNLTIEHMKDFNRVVPDHPEVYYQSFGSSITPDYPSWFVRKQYQIVNSYEGQNDALVSENSAQWTNFRGLVKGNDDFGISHFDIIGLRAISSVSTFNASVFYAKIVGNLKQKGF